MFLIGKHVSEVTAEDLRALVESSATESRTLEFKSELPGGGADDRREFLADVSALANTVGGVIVFGVVEQNGSAAELNPIPAETIDEALLRLENIAKSGLDPSIQGIEMRAVPVGDDGACVVVGVPRSWALPHRVVFRGSGKFYARNSRGKYEMDVSDLRRSFMLGATLQERAEVFRRTRLEHIRGDDQLLERSAEGSAELLGTGMIAVHLIPFDAFDPGVGIDLEALPNETGQLAPIHTNGWSHRFTFDGFVTHNASGGHGASTYLLLFRSGAIEAVDTGILGGERQLIPSTLYEQELLAAVPRFLNAQQRAGVSPPIFLMVSLLDVAGYAMAVGPTWRGGHGHTIDRPDLIMPVQILQNYADDVTDKLRPVFDAVWNAAGWGCSLNFDAGGEWQPR